MGAVSSTAVDLVYDCNSEQLTGHHLHCSTTGSMLRLSNRHSRWASFGNQLQHAFTRLFTGYIDLYGGYVRFTSGRQLQDERLPCASRHQGTVAPLVGLVGSTAEAADRMECRRFHAFFSSSSSPPLPHNSLRLAKETPGEILTLFCCHRTTDEGRVQADYWRRWMALCC